MCEHVNEHIIKPTFSPGSSKWKHPNPPPILQPFNTHYPFGQNCGLEQKENKFKSETVLIKERVRKNFKSSTKMKHRNELQISIIQVTQAILPCITKNLVKFLNQDSKSIKKKHFKSKFQNWAKTTTSFSRKLRSLIHSSKNYGWEKKQDNRQNRYSNLDYSRKS